QNIKRMLAYSGISHMGFFLLGMLSGTADGYAASLAYVLIYALITVATFAVVLSLSGPNHEAEYLNDYKGLGRVHPWLAFLMLLLMVSLAGIPPTLGFFAKLVVLQAVIDVGLVWVAVGAVLFAVIGAFYYLRIVKLMYFDAPADNSPMLNVDKVVPVILSVNALAMVLVMPWLGLLADLCQDVVRSAVG
ncbi:MAG: proton-conducting transporter membrane subunit, partial [Arenicellales bacterium]|nr:proton-conducting transporter membrane subunit [Arenicellales bacterium]